MKGSKILLFIASILLALLTVSFIFPSNGISVTPSTHINFPKLRDLTTIEEIIENGANCTDTLDSYTNPCEATEQIIYDGGLILPQPNYLDAAWETMATAKEAKRTVRILHYGDSQIELDRISSKLRQYMQHQFGGGGPGLIPYRKIIPTPVVSTSTDGVFTHYSSFGDSTVVRSRGNYGPMMQCFMQKSPTSSLIIRATSDTKQDSLVRNFSSVSLLYKSTANPIKATLSVRKLNYRNAQKGTIGDVAKIQWQLDTSTDRARIDLTGQETFLYGVMVDKDGGVAVDNIPMRGCSGQQFTLVNQQLLHDAYQQMDVSLILLQFGGNSVPYLKSEKSISTYCRSLAKQIRYIKQAAPHSCIVFIGPSDISKRINGRMASYPMLPTIIDSLKNMALDEGAGYWSIYHAMGGENSMSDWVKKGLAGSDHIHFSQAGADVMGDHLVQAFDEDYKRFLKHNTRH
ncbi:MAG: hypothetical protein IJ761_05695 [Bacteroidales bacterium]|nr:hypothetical protein [Bacteroidales bacterium]